MRFRKLGNTNLVVSVVGFGASPLGNVFGTIDPKEAEEAVHLAIDKGINYFDVSPYYGMTLAEQRLGDALAGRRDKVILATKCGRYGAASFDFSGRRIREEFENSLRRLRTDYVDLLQVHDVEFGDICQIIDEAIPALRELQEQGKARYIGISGYPLKILLRIAETVPVDTILTYCRYNLMITDMDDVLSPMAQKHGIGLINASALNMGILSEEGAPDWHPAPMEVRNAGKKAAEYCRNRGVNISELAMRFCLDHPYVATTLVGMSTRHHVESNIESLASTTDPKLLSEVREILAPVLDYKWASGTPENRG
jgi:L-galactose dehydrogenase